MDGTTPKKKMKIGEIRKNSCCPPPAEKEEKAVSCCGETSSKGPDIAVSVTGRVTSVWSREDTLGEIRCRLGNSFRMNYRVAPGLYAIGNPDDKSDVFVSANYKLSFDKLRSGLSGLNAWILVLDTKGINVWCAAGKGTFGTDELIYRITETNLRKAVSHKRIIVPQLGGPGVAAHVVQKMTGFRVYYGPVYAADIKAYTEAGYKATPEMRKIDFDFIDRLVLTPMELVPALKRFPQFAFIMLLIFGLMPSGILFKEALKGALPFLSLGLLSIISGALFTPLFISLIPSRAFTVKGWAAGLLFTVLALKPLGVTDNLLMAASLIFFPVASSYIAFQFTGSTTFTTMSGVKKELKYAIPLYITGVLLSILLLMAYKFSSWSPL